MDSTRPNPPRSEPRNGSANGAKPARKLSAVDDVMGGKPQLVSNGTAIATRPNFVDPWQWDNPHWRPAVVRGNGSASG